jgi:hypothetical protein
LPASVTTFSKMSPMKEFMTPMPFLEMPVSVGGGEREGEGRGKG